MYNTFELLYLWVIRLTEKLSFLKVIIPDDKAGPELKQFCFLYNRPEKKS